nr:unnamed protein product [Callosobruchus analis]
MVNYLKESREKDLLCDVIVLIIPSGNCKETVIAVNLADHLGQTLDFTVECCPTKNDNSNQDRITFRNTSASNMQYLSPPHEGVPRQGPKKCVNCGGSHSAAYRECPSYKTEAKIQKVTVVEGISYGEAKRKAIVNTPKQNTSYATITSKAPEISVKDIIASLIPHIETAIRNAVRSSVMKPNELGPPLPPPSLPPPNTSSGRARSDSASTSISATSEKRKEQDESTTDEDDYGYNGIRVNYIYGCKICTLANRMFLNIMVTILPPFLFQLPSSSEEWLDIANWYEAK